MGGLEPVLYLAKNSRVMLTHNLWTEVGLRNGALGTVRHVIYAEGRCPPVLPIAIIVQFDKKDYSRPSFCDSIANYVPIYPVTNSSDIYGKTRTTVISTQACLVHYHSQGPGL